MANKTKKSRFLTSFICIFVGVVLVFGIVMGVIIAINNSHAVVRSGSLTMEEGVVNYFASTFKITYIAGLKSSGVKGVKDDPDFWAATSDDGNTAWGDRLRAEFREYLSELMAANTIYNSRTRSKITGKSNIFAFIINSGAYRFSINFADYIFLE